MQTRFEGKSSLHPPSSEQGAALLVAMVMIFLLSLMGVSAMRSATLERQMVSNAVQSRDVFQAAESSNEIVLNSFANLTSAFESATQSIVIDTEVREGIGLQSQVTLRYIGEGNASGASLSAMQGANSFDALRFVAEGVAKVDAIRASRRIDQGATRTVPAN
ncbi:MAG: PilX N-terminal domain-containing pilus assembly protein [Granulosicoccus sp.]